MTFLILGHRGYLGRSLMLALGRRHRALGWDQKEDLFSLTPEVLAREKVDVVVNLSLALENAPGPFRIDNPSDKVNVEGARHLARVLAGTQVGWIQISTKEVFGPVVLGPKDVIRRAGGNRPKRLVHEDQPFAPQTVYAKSKLVAELFSESHPRSNVIRLSTCYTDFDSNLPHWVVLILKKAVSGQPVPLTGGGRQFRDPLHVDDLAALMEELAAKGIWGHRFNAGGGAANILSLLEVVRLANPKARIERKPGGDVGFAFSNRLASRLTSWRPKVKLAERIPTLLESYRAGRFAPQHDLVVGAA